ncbi:MAG TPA: hypothetical protein VFL93_08105 [Longimicrobiaceae bacterium]|nr:hypothetical protein [Longimicrobiaceae bacterium]
MQHLSEETLARLVAEEPTPEEAAHLAGCAECAAELAAYTEQTEALAALPMLEAPGRVWAGIEDGLVERARTRQRRASWLRAAAAVVLFAGGVGAGSLARGGADAPPAPRTEAEAAVQLREAQAAYVAALTRYSEMTGSDRAVDPASRLAALEGIVLTTRAALKQAPADPVINGYHLAAVGQRDALLHQISRAAAPVQTWY